MKKEEIETFCPTSRKDWRQWLKKNHNSRQSIWLVCYKMKSNIPTISWIEAVEEALCFGWIDSKRISLDDEKFRQFFCRRKPKSVWSKINKEKVERLIKEGLMTEAGYQSIAIAKENNSWTILDDVEKLTIPKDLIKEFKTKTGSKDYFLSLSKSMQKMILQWLIMAKRPETRQKRIIEIVMAAEMKQKPKQFM
jgi:uncharacterized protein YdeI (YjbR/CyaY-like superfamily)